MDDGHRFQSCDHEIFLSPGTKFVEGIARFHDDDGDSMTSEDDDTEGSTHYPSSEDEEVSQPSTPAHATSQDFPNQEADMTSLLSGIGNPFF